MSIGVIRGYKLAKLSKFAPAENYRYDGPLQSRQVLSIYKEEHKGFEMWKFFVRR